MEQDNNSNNVSQNSPNQVNEDSNVVDNLSEVNNQGQGETFNVPVSTDQNPTPSPAQPFSDVRPIEQPNPEQITPPQSVEPAPVMSGSNISSEQASNNMGQTNQTMMPADSISQTTEQPQTLPVTAVNTKKKSPLKGILIFVLVIALIAGCSFAAYKYGKSKAPVKTLSVVANIDKPISLPPSAIVTSACTPGRGKQYIIPKDIPEGPIYDVVNTKVIAIEYVFGVNQILSDSSGFSSILLNLSKNYPVDHFTLIPEAPQPGQTGEFVHLIMFVVPASASNAITCGNTSTSSTTASPTSPTATTPIINTPTTTTTKK